MAQLRKAIAQLMETRPERPAPPRDGQGIAAVVARLRAHLDAADAALAEPFAEALLASAQPALDGDADSAPLAAMAAGAFVLLRDRGRAPMALRVFTPQVDRDGWSAPVTVLETVLDDRPFIVETVTALAESAGGTVRRLFHPLFAVERAADGRVTRIGPAATGSPRESLLHLQVAGLPASAAAGLQQQLAERLHALMLVTADHAAMQARVVAMIDGLRAAPLPSPWDAEQEEIAAWLEAEVAQPPFMCLGYREYELAGADGNRTATVRAGRELGILRAVERSRWATAQPLPAPLAARLTQPPLLLVTRTTASSPVGRAAPMDEIVLKEVDDAGRLVGARRLLGFLPAPNESEPASEAPLLRRRLAALLAAEGTVRDSYDWRELTALFDSLPRGMLLAARADDVRDVLRAIRVAAATVQADVRLSPDAHGRGLFTTIILPRSRFSTELHTHVTATVTRLLGGPLLLDALALDDRPVVRLHYHTAVDAERLADPPVAALRAALGDLLQTWDDSLRETLASSSAAAESARLATRYAHVFPAAYKAGTAAESAARDVRCIEALLASGEAQLELVAATAIGPAALKLYLRDTPLALSDFVPQLEHFGLRVLGQDVIELAVPEGGRVTLHTFTLERADGTPLDAAALAPRLLAGVRAVRAGVAADDRLNALLTLTELDWRAVSILRAYADHAHQTGVSSRPTIDAALLAAPACAQALAAWFAAKFDPTDSPLAPPDRAVGPVAAAERAFLAALATVRSVRDGRPLRALGAAVAATVRTNAYATPPGAPIALKLDPARLPHLPEPRPACETWVHGIGLRGIHLRGGPVARGGIRFSDRPDDLRTEILELQRTQTVKNAIIVPVGAKGGFALTDAAAAADPAEVAAAYEAFIDALLQITDTRDRGQVVHPVEVLRYDGDDSYLVVAADRGTAAFSDRANAIAAERGFWLDDAFASGGRHGYDHKRLGITARGAWECARQHFREMERDLDRDIVRVVGIGDMSGDVFGNGMRQSRRLALVAAFDHRHVFVDPHPDPERAARERERLFALPGSSWADYAPAALGPGGGVYGRDAAAVALSAEARALLGIGETVSGEDLVRAVLCLPVDLLWNGGIGTYVKASDETHAEVGDPANDAVRIDARDLRAAVVVEGGNLGLTQRARIEYALAGGRIHTDAIDNAAGVDCSDHEVNLKIALQPLVAARELTPTARAHLLAELAEPVCAAVLSHSRRQARVLACDQVRSRTQVAAFRDLMTILEEEAALDRHRAHLPTRDALRLRRGVYLGLTRPELAVLLALTKLDLRHRIEAAPLADDPELEPFLLGYFPAALEARHPTAARRHALRREIAALELASRLVDTMGVAFLVRVVRDTGRDVLDAIRAWTGAYLLADGAGLAAELDAIDERLPARGAQHAALLLAEGLERGTIWVIDRLQADALLAGLRHELGATVAEVLAIWPDVLPTERRTAYDAAVSELGALGVPEALAERLVRVGALDEACAIAQLGVRARVPLRAVASTYLQTGPLLGLDWLRQTLPGLASVEDRWTPRAVAGLLDALAETRRTVTEDVLAQLRLDMPVEAAVAAYVQQHREQLEIIAGVIGDLRAAPQPALAAMLVAIRELGRLTRRT